MGEGEGQRLGPELKGVGGMMMEDRVRRLEFRGLGFGFWVSLRQHQLLVTQLHPPPRTHFFPSCWRWSWPKPRRGWVEGTFRRSVGRHSWLLVGWLPGDGGGAAAEKTKEESDDDCGI